MIDREPLKRDANGDASPTQRSGATSELVAAALGLALLPPAPEWRAFVRKLAYGKCTLTQIKAANVRSRIQSLDERFFGGGGR
jgi:hypothetical protein